MRWWLLLAMLFGCAHGRDPVAAEVPAKAVDRTLRGRSGCSQRQQSWICMQSRRSFGWQNLAQKTERRRLAADLRDDQIGVDHGLVRPDQGCSVRLRYVSPD